MSCDNIDFALDEIGDFVDRKQIQRNVPLSEISRWRIGGTARGMVDVAGTSQTQRVVEVLRRHNVLTLVIGETSNLLFDDDGFSGVLIRVGHLTSEIYLRSNRAFVGAGARVPELVRTLAEKGLGGIGHAAGIPGTLGGLVVMNGGSQRKGIGAHVAGVAIVDSDANVVRLSRDELSFSYRHSALQDMHAIVLEVELLLEPVDPDVAIAEIEAVLAARAGKFPLDFPNCGSTFLSDPEMYPVVGPPGKVIENAGLKGLKIGGAQVSFKHANFIVNTGNARAVDVLELISTIRAEVFSSTHFLLGCEVRFVSSSGEVTPAHEIADEMFPSIVSEIGRDA